MKTNKVKVSVVLPVYNVQNFLEQCLDSIIAQTLKDIEIICVDDGSTDNSLQILTEYAQKDDRIIVLQQKNAGAGAARNKGLEVATGEFVSFLDSDDFFELNMLEITYSKAKERDVDFIVFRCNQYGNQTGNYAPMDWTIRRYLLPSKEIFSYQDISRDIFRLFNGWAWDKLYSKSFIDKYNLRFQEIRTTNDAFFVFSALVKAKRISTLEDVLVHQRVNVKTSLSRTRDKSWDCCYEAIKALKNEFVKMGVYSEIEQSFINWVLNFTLWNVRTLEGDAKNALIKTLNKQCFVELGFSKFPKEYFYNQNEYQMYLNLCQYGAEAKVQGNNLQKTVRYLQENGVKATARKIVAVLSGKDTV